MCWLSLHIFLQLLGGGVFECFVSFDADFVAFSGAIYLVGLQLVGRDKILFYN